MKQPHLILSFATLIIAGLLATPVLAQTTAQERAATLRQQLVELQEKQAELETQRQQLDEDLKPENIEKGLAGVGSTKPEELREQRRRQLEIQRKSVQTQLDQLANNRTRLETAVLQADAAAYQSSAAGVNAGTVEKQTATPQPTSSQPAPDPAPGVQRRRRGNRNKPRPRRIRRSE